MPGFIDSDGDNAFAGGDLYKNTMVNDFVVPSGDYLAVEDDKIDELETVMTIVGGKVAWEK